MPRFSLPWIRATYGVDAARIFQELYSQLRDNHEAPLPCQRLLTLDLVAYAEALLLSQGSQASIEFVSSAPLMLQSAALKKALRRDHLASRKKKKKNTHAPLMHHTHPLSGDIQAHYDLPSQKISRILFYMIQND